MDIPSNLLNDLREHGQEHVLAGWDDLSTDARKKLIAQLERINLAELRHLYERRDEKAGLPPLESIAPLPRPADDAGDSRPLAEAAFRKGEIAFLIVAGGQGSRLGFEHPKGMFPIGPVSNKTLFQIHAEKVLALCRRYEREFPLLIMTSSVTHDETLAFFAEHANFGLPVVKFFQQRSMPALDLATGRLLMEAKGQLFLGPDGHGGTITGLAENGLLDWLTSRGVSTISYFQVDNPIVKLNDFVFVGRHLAARAEVSTKVVEKQFATERLGNLALINGRCGIIEYSDLPESLAAAVDEQKRPIFWAGNTAIHLLDVDFLRRMTDAGALPWHLARKKAPALDASGKVVSPDRENALKFERFIFDILPRADRWTVTATTRPEEFEPVKNATGAESPTTAKQAIVEQAGRWLESLGVNVPRDASGNVSVPIEISPLAALEPSDLSGRIWKSVTIEGPLYIE